MSLKHQKMCSGLFAIACGALLASPVAAAVTTVALYDANSQATAPNPTSTAGGAWAVAFSGAVTAEATTVGTDNAWRTVANTTTFVNYTKSVGVGTLDSPDTDWVATARVQVGFATAATNALQLRVQDRWSVWTLSFRLTSAVDDGWTYLRADGTHAPLQAGSVQGMQTWQMKYDSATESLSYFRNNVQVGPVLTRADVFDAPTQDFNAIRWGKQTSVSSSTTANWNYVSLETTVNTPVIPEPASVALMALGGLAMLTRRRPSAVTAWK